jgi:hypothetical protein
MPPVFVAAVDWKNRWRSKQPGRSQTDYPVRRKVIVGRWWFPKDVVALRRTNFSASVLHGSSLNKTPRQLGRSSLTYRCDRAVLHQCTRALTNDDAGSESYPDAIYTSIYGATILLFVSSSWTLVLLRVFHSLTRLDK